MRVAQAPAIETEPPLADVVGGVAALAVRPRGEWGRCLPRFGAAGEAGEGQARYGVVGW